jgi:hypothetical protein
MTRFRFRLTCFIPCWCTGPIDAWVSSFMDVLKIVDVHTQRAGKKCYPFYQDPKEIAYRRRQEIIIPKKINKTLAKSDALQAFTALYYISTQNNLLSHLFQVEVMWATAQRYNRSVIAAPVYSSALATEQERDICLSDFLVLPPSLKCSIHNIST